MAMRSAPRFGFYYTIAGVLLMGAGIFGPDVFHLSPGGKEIAFFLLMAAAFVCVLVGAIKEIQSEAKDSVGEGHRRRMIALIGMLVSGLAFIAFAGVYFWPPALEQVESPKSEHRATTPNFDRKLSLRCERSVRPTRFREDRRLYTLQIMDPPVNPSQTPFSAGAAYFSPGSGEINWNGMPEGEFSKCTLSNYSKDNMFNVSIKLNVKWLEVIKTENGFSSGKELRSAVLASPFFDLGAAIHSEDYFYIVNYGHVYVYIETPTIATIYTDDSDEPKTVSLVLPLGVLPGIFLEPAKFIAVPPTSPPPTPAPPDTPKEK
jgi:hypothetical protein